MAYNLNDFPLVKHLKALAEKVSALIETLTNRVKALEDTGAQANVLESIKVNGTVQTITDKAVDLTVPTKTSDLTNDSKFQTQEEVAAAVAAADHLKRKIVENTDAIDLTAADADQYIYMVLKSSTKNGDKYDEYMVLGGALEKVGDWTVDLSGYVEKEEGKGLSSNDYTTAEKEKLAGIEIATDEEIDEMLTEVFDA